jgi:hypothetical protein
MSKALRQRWLGEDDVPRLVAFSGVVREFVDPFMNTLKEPDLVRPVQGACIHFVVL